MNKLLLESIDNESRKGAINFLKANFNRCFPLEDQKLSQEEKDAKAKQYEENIELTYAEPWNIERACNWTKALLQGCWSGLPCPPPGDLPNLGIEPRSPSLKVDSLPSEPAGKPALAYVVLL